MDGGVMTAQIIYDENGRRIYQLGSGSLVISENGAWIPGVYADLPAALRAFEVDDRRLVELRDAVNANGSEAITLEMLRRRWR